MRSITTSQTKIRDLRESLIKAKGDLSTSKPEVKNMVDNSQKYDAMLQTLHSMFVTRPYCCPRNELTGWWLKRTTSARPRQAGGEDIGEEVPECRRTSRRCAQKDSTE